MSWLQELWWIRVLRPNSVCTGWTDRQEDFSPQSPQPSHTRSLIQTRSAGVSSWPRLRSRRFSVAQRSSWIRTVTPVDRRELGLHRPRSRRGGARRRSAASWTPR